MSKRVDLRNWLYRDLLLNGLAGSYLVPPSLRSRLLRLLGVRISGGAKLGSHAFFGSWRVTIGAGTYIGPQCFFDALERITIGKDCDIAMQVTFVTSSHEVNAEGARAGRSLRSPITVGDGTWIGARVTVMPGVTIGAGCIIGAGSLVLSDCEPGRTYVGSPARALN
jgi:maltose O-acetyltransferase